MDKLKNNGKGDEQMTKSRKVLRKEARKLKKMRIHAFMQKKKVPTVESIQKEEEEQQRLLEKQIKMKEKIKKKRKNSKIKREEKKMLDFKKNKELEILNKQDTKTLRDLEKKLRIKKDKGLPASFKRDNMDYILGYMEEAKACMFGTNYVSEHEDDEDEENGEKMKELKKAIKKKIVAKGDGEEKGNDDDDSKKDNDGHKILKSSKAKNTKRVHFEEDDESEGEEGDDEEEDDDYDDDEEDEEDEDDEEEEEVYDDDDDKEEDDDDDEEEYDDDDDKEEDDDLEPHAKKAKILLEPVKKSEIQKVPPKEDIYGRVIGSSGSYVPPAKRNLEKLNVEKGVTNEKLNRQIAGIFNKLNETNMQLFCNQVEEMFRMNSRQSVCNAIENGISKMCLVDELCPRSLIVHCCFMVAVLHSKVGIEISATFLQFVVTKFLEIFGNIISKDEDDYISNKINNCLMIICQLYDFKIIESILILDIVKKLLSRFEVKDINLISLLLKEVGPRLRKEDSVCFKELLQEVLTKTSQIKEKESSKKKLLSQNLTDLLTILKNNQLNKISTYDPESFTRRMKIFNNIIKTSTNHALRVTLEDIESSEIRGKWWLVGSAWSGKDNDALKEKSDEHEEPSSERFEQKLLQQAHEQKMNTSLRSSIFCTIMSAEDYTDAFQKLMAMNLKTEQQQEIMPVVITICLQGKKFNPFFVYLAQQFCRNHRRFMISCKFSLWDQIKMVSGMTKQKLNNLADFIKLLISMQAMPLSVLKNVEFTELDKQTTHFMDRILRHLLTKCEDFPKLFKAVSRNAGLKQLRAGLDLYLRVFYGADENENDVDNIMSQNVKLALKCLSETPADVKKNLLGDFDEDGLPGENFRDDSD